MLQEDLDMLKCWSDANKLCLNIRKTKSMLFISHRSENHDTKCNLITNDQPVESVDYFKYLGIEVERHLNFARHVNTVCK